MAENRDEPIRWAGAIEVQMRLKDLRFAMIDHLDRLMEGHKEVGREAIDRAIEKIDVAKAFRDEAASAIHAAIRDMAADSYVRVEPVVRAEVDAYLQSDAIAALVRAEIDHQVRRHVERAVAGLTWGVVDATPAIKDAIRAAIKES